MRTWGVIIASIMLAVSGLGVAPSSASAETETVETGRLLAILLDAGRVTV